MALRLCQEVWHQPRSGWGKIVEKLLLGYGLRKGVVVANPEHVEILKQGVKVWNKWREENPETKPDLSGAHLLGAILQRADLSGADLNGAFLRQAHLYGADLSKANLKNAILVGATLSKANLTGADLTGANLASCSMNEGTIVEGAILTESRVYGIATWGMIGKPADQSDLVITLDDEQTVTVDDLEIAQFIYLLLNNEKIRAVIDTIGEKGVLILGRFTPERKAVLDAIRDKLRELGFVPMMFDFEKPTQRDFTETIKTLAGMSRFIIADISEPKSIPLELQAIVPDYAIPVVPIFQIRQDEEAEEAFAMIRDLQKYDWVFDVLEYETPGVLLDSFEEEIVNPAKDKADSLLPQKAEGIRKRRLGEGK